MPPSIDLFDAEPDDQEPDLAADECGCQPADTQYLLTIEEGQAHIVHAACGKQPPSNWGDWNEATVMAPIPVTVEWQPECDGSAWHGMTPCDCGAIVQVTATSVPEDVRAAALELSRQHGRATVRATANVAAAGHVLFPKHTPAYYNRYGSVSAPGYRVDEGPDGKARIDHRMPEPDLSDPNRPSRDELAAERHRQVDAYAATLTAAGWTVERRGPHDQRPWLLAAPTTLKPLPENTP
jgi:hypothetical protein